MRQKKTRKRSNKNDIEEIELVSDPVHSDADALGPQDTPEQQEEAGTRTSTLIVNEAFENGSDLPDGDAAESEAKPKKQEVSVSTASPSTGDLALMEGSPQQKETKKSVEKAKKNKNKKEKDKKDNKDIKKEKKEKKEKKGVASSDRDTALLLAEEGGEEVKDATSSPLATAVENVVEQGGRGDKQQKQVVCYVITTYTRQRSICIIIIIIIIGSFIPVCVCACVALFSDAMLLGSTHWKSIINCTLYLSTYYIHYASSGWSFVKELEDLETKLAHSLIVCLLIQHSFIFKFADSALLKFKIANSALFKFEIADSALSSLRLQFEIADSANSTKQKTKTN